ncbi:cytochrome c biogenesis protein ResB [Roseibacillus ishigakijimensis]|uniref:Cytochrome c biogenesis protein ResB n=1 Tax=Roseibacillus ishigakijimensis TaxID=454146 RepID=A0A934VNX8_9BACT|nr:cytochrome c biogenesis protein ResB [Roseibacillus ishigakijimensis]MBK1835505.1 cytochrome c biogenesis protein ResB [Roseibacillus ishigakijimensis]
MEKSESTASARTSSGGRQLLKKAIQFLASMQLATFLLLALFVLTWFATLEQTVNGLKPMMDKYFNWKELFFFPEIGKPWQADGALVPIKIWFPMPSGFWLCALFTLNLTLGGLIRMRKSPQKLGILLTHFSIVFLMLGAGVTKFTEKRGALRIYEGEVSDAAQDYHEEVIEISELTDGQVSQVHVVDWQFLKDLRGGGERLFRLSALPFDLKVSNLLENAQVSPAQFIPPTAGERVLDGYYLKELSRQKETEAHHAGAEVTVLNKEGQAEKVLLLASRSLKPATITLAGKSYLLQMRKKLWPLPFKIQLDDFRVERDPGTNRAAAYESDITRLEGVETEEVLIQMNEPMRHRGWTFFQANWGPQDQENPTEYYSVFEVVRNPADHWPLYSLILSMIGLIGHFLYKLVQFLRKPRKPVTA